MKIDMDVEELDECKRDLCQNLDRETPPEEKMKLMSISRASISEVLAELG